MTYTTLISTEELAQHLGDSDFVIVDCRHNLADTAAGENAYRQAHIPGAHFLHLDRDLSGIKTGRNGRHPLPEVGALSSALGRIGIDASKQVIAYDQNTGMWASRLLWLLRWLGHERVAVLDGGVDKWVAERRALSTELPAQRRSTFTAKPAPLNVSAEEVLRHLGDRGMTILDARAPERYRGD